MNILTVTPNGPLIAQGDIRIEDAEGVLLATGNKIALCRCGSSQNKPFCDGAHQFSGFTDAVRIHDEKSEIPGAASQLLIVVKENAMLIAKGPMLIRNEGGDQQTTRNKAALCRCGRSKNKPFCDASHKNVGHCAG